MCVRLCRLKTEAKTGISFHQSQEQFSPSSAPLSPTGQSVRETDRTVSPQALRPEATCPLVSVSVAVGAGAASPWLALPELFLRLTGSLEPFSPAHLILPLPAEPAPTGAWPQIRRLEVGTPLRVGPRPARTQSAPPSPRRDGAHHPDSGPAGRWPQVGLLPPAVCFCAVSC